MSRLLVALSLASLALAAGCAVPHLDLMWPRGKRMPNAHERFYTAVAGNFGDPKMCGKIYKRAIDESCGPDMGCSEWRVNYERSTCFFFSALKTRDAKLCDSVESIAVVPSNHSEITKSACLESIRNNGQEPYILTPDYYGIGSMMAEMGYTKNDAADLLYSINSMMGPVFKFYTGIKETEELKSKVEALPNYAEPPSEDKVRRATEDELLMKLVAADDHLPSLCNKISPNSYYGPQANSKWPLRDNCIYDAAVAGNSPELCDSLLPVPSLSITAKWMSPDNCKLQIKSIDFSRGKKVDNSTVPAFLTATSFAGALEKLGYENAILADPKFPDWSGIYQMLEFNAKPEQKQIFLSRAEELPDFTK